MKYISLLVLGLSLISCGDEHVTSQNVPVPGPAGPKGDSGADGRDGVDGLNGESCSVSTVTPGIEAPYGGALIICGTTSTLLLNGEPGPQGEAGPVSPYSLTEIIDPCNDAPGIYDEVLLRTQSGKLLASFSDNVNGYNTRLSEITQGNYMTTDGSNCHFSVDSLGNVSW